MALPGNHPPMTTNATLLRKLCSYAAVCCSPIRRLAHSPVRWWPRASISRWLALWLVLPAVGGGRLHATTYYVDQQAKNASDGNAGNAVAPWKTIGRAATGKKLQPGDVVLIRSGIYREHVELKVSGTPGQPITFAAAPEARVVIKGSELVQGTWKKLGAAAQGKEPFPGAWADVWSIKLGDEFFEDPAFAGSYRERSARWVSQVFLNEHQPLQRIGLDPVYTNAPFPKLTTIGQGLADLTKDSFYFSAEEQVLYVKIAGEPYYFSIEVGVRGFVLSARAVHDVVLRGLELRQNRQPGGSWSLAGLQSCERVTLEDCRFLQADFCGLSLYRSTNCVVKGCDLSYNGNTGLALSESEDCVVENSTLLFNNYRRFHAEWHAGGLKAIPANRRCVVRGCEVAYNTDAPGIWFDYQNSDIRILGNVCHHNGGQGIFFEINPGPGLIADNLVYANRGRGIYVSGSQNTSVVHNTLAENGGGIMVMPRSATEPVDNSLVLNNLFLHNSLAVENQARGADLTLYMGDLVTTLFKRSILDVHSDFNVFASNAGPPAVRHHWNPDNTLAQWQKRFEEDTHSKSQSVPYALRGSGFQLLGREGLDGAGPLPENLRWQPATAGRVGSSLTHWP